ncbi:transporter [Phaeovulum sp. NW3]|uniref:transporter n=1 Tax=Phaeovulum sp. NW3 TaxID=2934933 RepID=UPI002021AA67|nr:transporter [Phaeovulum sp. NW3]MCL7466739.1 transporter [Phaeovulum sp. NW3]
MQPLTFGGDYRYFGIATYLTLPTGDYSSTEPSLGTNRWSMAIQPAFLFNVAPNWSVDLVGDVTIYGDNDDGLGGATVEKDPSFTALGWVNYHASEKTTVSIGATTSWGGAETVGGIQGVDVKSTTVRAAWSQLLTPTSQFMMEVGHDVEAENTFERDTTVTLRLAKFF